MDGLESKTHMKKLFFKQKKVAELMNLDNNYHCVAQNIWVQPESGF